MYNIIVMPLSWFFWRANSNSKFFNTEKSFLSSTVFSQFYFMKEVILTLNRVGFLVDLGQWNHTQWTF